jgi:pimeloyl-ACP methyl ester carboxylesterase
MSEVTYTTRGLVVQEIETLVPLDHRDPGGEKIRIFAREVADPDGRKRPYLAFLQGGPGFEAPRPFRHPTSPGWLDRALREYRVLMIDQRGTGRSTPFGPATVEGKTPAEVADYLTFFRADSIVRDAESWRGALGVERWSILGQSFGGFCVTSYLSLAPDRLDAAFITGGLPPVGAPADDVYRATFARIFERNVRHYTRYPRDRDVVRDLVDRLVTDPIVLPSGDELTVRRFRQLGQMLGMSDGSERLHYILELDPDSPAFAHDVEAALEFARNPLYAIVHEACYADGGATRWSADRVMPDYFRNDPTLLTGEHVFPWMFEDYGALKPFRQAANILAAHPWGRLYDNEKLAANKVPVAAAIYADDPYVERRFSEETAELIRGLRPWVTNEYDHNGLRADGDRILSRLIDLARGRA